MRLPEGEGRRKGEEAMERNEPTRPGDSAGHDTRESGRSEQNRETYFDDEGVFYWMDRDEEKGLEPLSWLGNRFPQGCRFCM